MTHRDDRAAGRASMIGAVIVATACSASSVMDAGGVADDAPSAIDAGLDPDADAGPVPWARDLVAGDDFTCVLALDGTVWCFGRGLEGELGDGAQSESSTPRRAVGLADVVRLTAGRTHACAVDAGGSVYCWGDAAFGKTGTGEHDTPVLVPTRVAGIDDAVEVRAGQYDTCAVHRSGAVSCWGDNRFGQVGIPPPSSCATGPSCPSQDSAVTVTGVTDAVAVWFTIDGVCARHATGGAACWGGGTLPFVPAVEEPMLADAADVREGWNHDCVLRPTGAVACVGANEHGELGMPGASTTTLVDVPGLSGIVGLAAHGAATCAVGGDGTLACWGDDDDARLGDGLPGPARTPIRVALDGVTAVAVGGWVSEGHTCAIARGAVHCWGRAGDGQTGSGAETFETMPREVVGPSNVVRLSAGSEHTCSVDDTGQLQCWGRNREGQLGLGTTDDTAAPTRVLIAAREIAAGHHHTCAITAGADLECWGENNDGQLGRLTGSPLVPGPVYVSGIRGVVAAAGIRTGVVTSAHTASFWGGRFEGEDGLTTSTYGVRQTTSPAPTDAIALAMGPNHSCALGADGAVTCFGADHTGEIGDGPTIAIGPQRVTGLPPVVAIGAGGVIDRLGETGTAASCALAADGRAWCWGGNQLGELGDGTRVERDSPVPLAIAAGVSIGAIATDGGHTCAVASDGTAYCWGDGRLGQLGNGTTSDSAAPVMVADAARDFVGVSVGQAHSCAFRRSGAVSCWGSNARGQLGASAVIVDLAPHLVASPAP